MKQGKDNGQWYTGKTEDEATSFVYMNARYYDPEIARFISPDPVHFTEQNPFSFNRYAYANNNPLKFVDPDGRETLLIHNGITSGNPFGHSALATTGSGIYSFGNGTTLGSSVTDYILREMPRRNSWLYVINTTTSQEQAMINYLKEKQLYPLQKWPDNCAERISGALGAAGLPYPSFFGRIPSWPRDVEEQGQFWQAILGGETIKIPKIDVNNANNFNLLYRLQIFNPE